MHFSREFGWSLMLTIQRMCTYDTLLKVPALYVCDFEYLVGVL